MNKLNFLKRYFMAKKNKEIEDVKELVNINDVIKVSNESIKVLVKKLTEDAELPTYAHDGDVGMDMKCVSVEYDELHDLYIYHTGLALETPMRTGILLFPRSSNRKTDVYLTNSVGVADTALYRGEILFCYKDRISTYERAHIVGFKAYMKALEEGKSYREANIEYSEARERIFEMTKKLEFAPYQKGHKIGQMVLLKFPNMVVEESDTLSDTVRGDKGFGSTGQ